MKNYAELRDDLLPEQKAAHKRRVNKLHSKWKRLNKKYGLDYLGDVPLKAMEISDPELFTSIAREEAVLGGTPRQIHDRVLERYRGRFNKATGAGSGY